MHDAMQGGLVRVNVTERDGGWWVVQKCNY